MSRVGKNPVQIPEGVEVKLEGRILKASSSGKELEYEIPEGISVSVEDKLIILKRDNDTKQGRSLQGLSRSLISNMVTGLKDGFTRKLEMVGRGKRAKVQGKTLVLEIGFSHPVEFPLPEGIEAKVERNIIELSGYDKHVLGQTAANIRRIQPPEPYKGSGIRYQDEHVKKKAGKAAIGGGFTGAGK